MNEPQFVPFGDYKPDVAPILNDGLSVAKNTVPIRGGYGPIRAIAQDSAFTALAERPRGALASIDPAGNPWNVVGTQTKLYLLKSSTTDVTRSSGPYNASEDAIWEFVEFGDYVIAVNPNDDPQYFEIGTSTEFARLGDTVVVPAVYAPRAAHIGVIGSFVILGNTFDSVFGEGKNAIHWSAIGNPFFWPEVGSDEARAVQSDRQVLQGAGGVVQRVVSGAEVGAIFQERAVWRAEYRGGDGVFDLSRVEPDRGLLVPQIAIPFGRMVFYLAEDGFYLFDYTQSVSIGNQIVDRTFLADLDTSYFERVSAVKDPDTKRIWILYPGSGNTAGVPNKYLVYDWGLNRFSHGEIDAEWLTLSVAAGVNLDSPHTAADPDTDGVDGAGLVSFDARIAAPGALRLGAYNTSYELCDFSGFVRPATLETGRRSLHPAMRSLVSMAEALVDNVDPTIQCAGLSKTNDTPRFHQPSRINEDGMSPLRCDGRYHAFRVNLPVGWNNALGMNVWSAPSGVR